MLVRITHLAHIIIGEETIRHKFTLSSSVSIHCKIVPNAPIPLSTLLVTVPYSTVTFIKIYRIDSNSCHSCLNIILIKMIFF